MTKPDQLIENALAIAFRYGTTDGDHHKAWVIDQMVRALLGCPMVKGKAIDCNGLPYTFKEQGTSKQYKAWVKERKAGEDGPDTYAWNEGIAP